MSCSAVVLRSWETAWIVGFFVALVGEESWDGWSRCRVCVEKAFSCVWVIF